MLNPHTPYGLPMEQISRAIGLARILLIVGLIFLHYGSFPNSTATPFDGYDPAAHPLATWMNSAILFFFFSAVPLLSLISGWLFFSFTPQEAWPAIRGRIRRRVTSLYMPLVAWNLAYLAALYAVFVLRPDAGFFNHSTRIGLDFATAGWFDYLNAITGLADIPVAFQFWFVRDLFVTTLVSPLLWLLLRHAPWAGAALLCAAWLDGSGMLIFFRPDVPFFFYLGALMRQKHLRVDISLRLTLYMLAIYVALAMLRAGAPYLVDLSGGAHPFWLDAATRAMRIPGVIACWGLIYRYAQTPRGAALSALGGLAFFLHSAHWPLLAVVKVALWKLVPGDGDLWMLAHYAASVALTAIIGLGGGMMLAALFPRLFSLMNGGRLLGSLAMPRAAQEIRAAA